MIKKSRLLLLIILAVQTSLAQKITFTDSIFKKSLLDSEFKIDLNNNGEIEFREAELITSLNVSKKGITDISEISYFKNLEKLECYYNNIKFLIIQDLPKLKQINCGTNKMQILKLTNLPLLIELEAGNNELTSIEMTECSNVKTINIQLNHLTRIDVTKVLLLENLSISDNHLTSIDLSHNSKLKQLFVDNNKLTELDIRKNLELNNVYADDNVKQIINSKQKANSPFLMKPPPEE